MKLLLTLIAFLSSLSAHAILIEDSPDRLVFDVTWDGGWQSTGGGGLGTNGSRVINLGNQWSRNPYKFLFEIRWMIDGVFLPTTALQVSFRNDPEDFSPLPDLVLGSPGFIQESPWTLAIPGNPHGVRFIRGLPYPEPVPDAGGTLPLLALGLAALAASVPRPASSHPEPPPQ